MPKFVPRQRKQKARLRQDASAKANSGDTNTVELVPATKAEREERRKRLREELRGQQPNISKKKQKRLDKYIENKIKKEENLDLIKKLAQSKVDTSLFISSKKLGRVTESKRETLARALKERNAGINVDENNEVLFDPRKQAPGSPSSESVENSSDHEYSRPSLSQPENGTVAFGIGLKRPLEIGEDGRPLLKRRKRTKAAHPRFHLPEDDGEGEWKGFASDMSNDHSSPEAATDEASSTVSTEDLPLSNDAEISSSEGSVNESGVGEFSDFDSNDGTEPSGDEKAAEDDDRKARSSIFKAWATQQRNEVLGFVPSAVIPSNDSYQTHNSTIELKPRPPEVDPLPPELEIKNTTGAPRETFSVLVERPSQVQNARLALPVVAEEQKIMEAIHYHDVVVIWGATGSGKTTQVPQFLYEAGYGCPHGPTPGLIGVTQPRRVAAVSMSKRVGDELGDAQDRVSYQIRFESSVSDRTAIKFMTDGVLLREIAQDFALSKYSAIIIDEAHERSVNTDILIGMMSRIVDLRMQLSQEDSKTKPLKLIIMSATLRISDFTQNQTLFRKEVPPLVQAEGRQYPVTIHFARRTERDYVEEMFRKVTRGHRKLPPGGMLVFMTGQSEIKALSKRLKETFVSTSIAELKLPEVRVSAAEAPLEDEDLDIGDMMTKAHDHDLSDGEAEFHGLDGVDEEEFDVGESSNGMLKVHVLPLYSQLPTSQQLRVFDPPPEGSRLIVLATNVAETSLTIPGIRYVFDCGRAKEKKYDSVTGVQSFEIDWISKASAAQRAGRAGRTGPGHCYRLYSSAVYERDFAEYAEPEIVRTPVEEVVLQLKSMDLQHVVNFPFPTPPSRQSLAQAEKLLAYLGALTPEGKITPVGRELAMYPLSPRFARMLLISQAQKCTAYAIALVAALAVPDLFIPANQLDSDETTRDEAGDDDGDPAHEDITHPSSRQKAYNTAQAAFSRWDRTSDALKHLTAICAAAHAPDPAAFAAETFLRPKALEEASRLRSQLTLLVARARHSHNNGAAPSPNPDLRLPQPSAQQIRLLNQIAAAGFIDHVAQRADLSPAPPTSDSLPRKPRRAIDVPYIPLFSSSAVSSSSSEDSDRYVYLHPSSVLAHSTAPGKLPQYIIYDYLQRSSSSSLSAAGSKIRMRALTPVSAAQLVALATGTPLLEWGKPLGKVTVLERAPGGQERREAWVMASLVGEKGAGLGWPLVAKRVVQKREVGKGWIIEKVLER